MAASKSVLLAGLLLLICVCAQACSRSDEGRTEGGASGRGDLAARLADLYREDAYWPTRVWLEAPLLGDGDAVVVPPRRMGVVIFLEPNGDVRIDFGRYGAHTVPIEQTNFVAESARVRAGEATKTFPNLLGMLMNRVVDAGSDSLATKQLVAEDIRGGPILLVFADAKTADVEALTAFASKVAEGAHRVSTFFLPITEELDGDVLSDLRAGGWTDPFVMTPMADAYVTAMLEPGTPRPFARLCTDEGRILAQGPPDDATLAAMLAALEPADG
jgi:hypothetical protein